MSDYLRPLCDSGQALRPCKLHHAVHQRLHGERQEAVVRLLVEALVTASQPHGFALSVLAAIMDTCTDYAFTFIIKASY